MLTKFRHKLLQQLHRTREVGERNSPLAFRPVRTPGCNWMLWVSRCLLHTETNKMDALSGQTSERASTLIVPVRAHQIPPHASRCPYLDKHMARTRVTQHLHRKPGHQKLAEFSIGNTQNLAALFFKEKKKSPQFEYHRLSIPRSVQIRRLKYPFHPNPKCSLNWH